MIQERLRRGLLCWPIENFSGESLKQIKKAQAWLRANPNKNSDDYFSSNQECQELAKRELRLKVETWELRQKIKSLGITLEHTDQALKKLLQNN